MFLVLAETLIAHLRTVTTASLIESYVDFFLTHGLLAKSNDLGIFAAIRSDLNLVSASLVATSALML